MSKFRTGVVGVGGIGKWHAKMHEDTGKFEVVALCDSNADLAAWAAEAHPKATFYDDFDAMLAAAELDFVSIVTPHNLHAPLAIKAVRAGVNALVEKPMATTYEDAVAMTEAAKASGKFVTVFHNRRLDPWFLTARSIIEQGLLGDLIELNSGIIYGPGPQTWRGHTEPSGGLLFDWGAHLVDYCLHLHPAEIATVSSVVWRRPGKPESEVDDHASLQIRFVDGAIANIGSSGIATTQPDRYRLVGTKGTLIDRWNWGADARMTVDTRLDCGNATTISVAYTKSETQAYYDNLAAHMTAGEPLLVSAESAARVINVLCTARRSAAAAGQPLPLA